MREPLDAVAAAEPVDRELASAAVDLERKFFHSVQLTQDAACPSAVRSRKAVVVDRHLPEIGRGEAVDMDDGPRNQRERSIKCTPDRSVRRRRNGGSARHSRS
jgi:hypothetical protein